MTNKILSRVSVFALTTIALKLKKYKFLRKLNQEQIFPEKMKYRGQDKNGSQPIAECFNEHFSSVFIEDNSDTVVPKSAQLQIFLHDINCNAKDVLEKISQINLALILMIKNNITP